MSSFGYFVLGIIISIPIAIAAPLGTAVIQRRLGIRSVRQGRRRREALEREYAIIKEYHEDQIKLLTYVGSRILILVLFYIGQEVLPAAASFMVFGGSIGAPGLNYETGGVSIAALTTAVAALLGAIILGLLFRTGFRAYRIIGKVMAFDQYESQVMSELADIRAREKTVQAETQVQWEGSTS
ncbi:MAG TPA: hypothetical protein VMG38_05835 [Trebonia sp.]|nr:hypothetical protein [Trebonia sp.]